MSWRAAVVIPWPAVMVSVPTVLLVRVVSVPVLAAPRGASTMCPESDTMDVLIPKLTPRAAHALWIVVEGILLLRCDADVQDVNPPFVGFLLLERDQREC